MARKIRRRANSKHILRISVAAITVIVSGLLLWNISTQSTSQIVSEDVEAFSGSSRWRYNAKHTGSSPSSEIKTLPALKWTFTCKMKSTNSFPAVTSDTVYYICPGDANAVPDQGQGIYALDKNTGALKWRNRNPGCPTTGIARIIPAPMEVINANIYTYICNEVTAINSSSGAIKWRSTGSNIRPPAFAVPLVGNNYVYIGGSNVLTGTNVTILAINKTDGKTVWSKQFTDQLSPHMALDIVGTTETVFVSGGAQALGLKGADGTILWTKTFPHVIKAPALQYPNLYFGSSTGNVYAIDRTTGATVWKFTADGPTSDMVSVAKNQVVFSTNKGSLYAVDATTGAQKWKVTYGKSVAEFLAPSGTVTSASGMIYIGNLSGEVKVFTVAGKLLYTIPAVSGAVATNFNAVVFDPVIVGGHIYLGTYSGILRAY